MDGQDGQDTGGSDENVSSGNQLMHRMESEDSPPQLVLQQSGDDSGSNGSIDIAAPNLGSMPMEIELSGHNETGSDHDNYSTLSQASDDMANGENNGVAGGPIEMVVHEDNDANNGDDIENGEMAGAVGGPDEQPPALAEIPESVRVIAHTLGILIGGESPDLGRNLRARHYIREMTARGNRRNGADNEIGPNVRPDAATPAQREMLEILAEMESEEAIEVSDFRVAQRNTVMAMLNELHDIRDNPDPDVADNARRDHMRLRLQRALYSYHRQRPRRDRAPDDDVAAEQVVEPENPVRFDTNLPTEHSYMGVEMSRVPGVNYLDVGQRYYMMIFMHEHIIYPGEVLPFMVSGSIFDDVDAGENGTLFGVCFPFLCKTVREENIYGVTCQIYEKGTDARGNTLIKSRALQRFAAKTEELTVPLHFIAAQPQMKSHGYVKILPEVYLPEPLSSINMGSMSRFRDNESMRSTYRRYQAASTPFQPYVYDLYSTTGIVETARKQLAQHKIDTMPTDPSQLSFWLVRNLHLHEGVMRKCFLANSVNQRMMLIGASLKQKESIFTCRYCGHSIANCSELFAMSKHGVQTHYCNSAGYIHETNTVYSLLRNAVMYRGEPSSEFSWFPGYQWRIIVCKICTRHVGWKFTANSANLVPNKFYGISSSSVRVTSSTNIPLEGSDIYSHLLRLANSRE